MRKLINKIWNWMQRYDSLWSMPLAAFMYWGAGFFFGNILGLTVGSFDLSFIQPLFLAALVTIGCSTVALYGLRFQWKALYRFIYSSKVTDEDLISVAAFRKLSPGSKIILTVFVYAMLFLSTLLVYLNIL